MREDGRCLVSQEVLLEERLHRIKTAVALEKPDRVPIVLEYAGLLLA